MSVLIKPSAQLDLAHRAYFLCGACSPSILVAASQDGNVTVIGPEHTEQTVFKRPCSIKAVSIHPTLPLLGFVEGEDNHLSIIDTRGLPMYETQPSGTGKILDFDSDGSGSCFFEVDGCHLWYAAARSRDEIEIQRLECGSWRVVGKTVIEDVYGESHLSFHPTGSPEKIALWLAAGQDGQQIYWLTGGDGDITCALEPYLEDMTPPVFSPSGHEFLVTDGTTALSKYQFPNIRLLGEYQWPEAEEQEETIGYSLCYVDEERALISSSLDRLFLLDSTEMVISQEVSVDCHEPQPVRVYFPSLVHDASVCTDITHFERFGDTLVFIFRRDHNTGLVPWEDTLLFSSVAALIRSNGIGC